jgi:hypothetical protein
MDDELFYSDKCHTMHTISITAIAQTVSFVMEAYRTTYSRPFRSPFFNPTRTRFLDQTCWRGQHRAPRIVHDQNTYLYPKDGVTKPAVVHSCTIEIFHACGVESAERFSGDAGRGVEKMSRLSKSTPARRLTSLVDANQILVISCFQAYHIWQILIYSPHNFCTGRTDNDRWVLSDAWTMEGWQKRRTG